MVSALAWPMAYKGEKFYEWAFRKTPKSRPPPLARNAPGQFTKKVRSISVTFDSTLRGTHRREVREIP